MKRIISLLIIITLSLTPFTAVQCEENIQVMLNDEPLVFDVPPQIIDGCTLVPMRTIFEALGANVEWHAETRTITAVKTNRQIIMEAENKFIHINSETIELEVPPMIIEERTLVPIRAVSESLNCTVDWDSATKTVKIHMSEENAPVIPIEYDDTAEREAHYIRNFKITEAVKNSGVYDITCKFETFLEGRGIVTVMFNCYDSDGNIVDTFGGGFTGTDYTWSSQEIKTSISDKTVKIGLVSV